MQFLKLGGSLITDKRIEAAARVDVIRRLANEVEDAISQQADLRLVIGHGSGSYGHYAASRFNFTYGRQTNWQAFVEIGAAAGRLNRMVVDSLLAAGVNGFPVQPSANARCRAGAIVSMDVQLIQSLLERGLVPVVYGDVCLDDEWGWTIISTEHILAYLGRALKPKRILLAGEVAGVHTGNPAADPNAELLSEITPDNFDTIRAGLTGADGYDVTGGMFGKVEMMVELVRSLPELEVRVISGLDAHQVRDALLGRPLARQTTIHA